MLSCRFLLGLGFCSFLGGVAAIYAALSIPNLPSFAAIRGQYRSSDLSLLARSGELLSRVRVDRTFRAGRWLSLSDYPEALPRALLQAEDRRFYSHTGVDLWALLRAGRDKLLGSPSGGASTISMQLSSLLAPSELRTSGRRSGFQKLLQVLSALSLESTWSKQEILEAYLNLVPFRGEIRGVDKASEVLLGVDARALSPQQSAALIAMLREPNAAREKVARRACEIFRALDPSEASGCDSARITQALATSPAKLLENPALSLPAAEALLRVVRKRGNSPLPQELHLEIDSELQQRGSEILRARLAPLRSRQAQDGAILVVHNESGKVLAYVPNSGKAASLKYVDGVQAYRQAGSTLKPFLYGRAFELGLITPRSVLNDSPLQLAVFSGLYRPANYDRQFRGPVSAETALASSLNIPALRVLHMLGTSEGARTLSRFGFQSVGNGDRFGYSMALGAPSVSLWELVRAYRALANAGELSELKLVQAPDKQEPAQALRVLDPEVARQVAMVLSNRETRSLTFGLENVLATPFWSAVKTGTSKDMTDNWCIGFTADYTVGVWVGNFSGQPMQDVSGISGAAPIWADMLDILVHQHGASSAQMPPKLASINSSDETSSPGPGEATIAASRPLQIVSPIDGASIAWDPDIPSNFQRVIFEAAHAKPQMSWVLDGKALASAQSPFLWTPRGGLHELEVRGVLGETVSKVTFSVRVAAAPGAPLR